MAAVAPTAMRILDAPFPEELSDRLAPFVYRVSGLTRGVKQTFREILAFPQRLEEGALDTWRASFSRKQRRTGTGRRTVDGGTYAYVPQPMWRDTFFELFADAAPGAREHYARQFCSMALLHVAGEDTWISAARLLGLPARRCRWAARAMSAQRKAGTDSLFEARLRELARGMAADPKRVNCGDRRRALSDFTVIGTDDWSRLPAGTPTGINTPELRRFGAAWIWCRFTGGDHRLAPGLKHSGSEVSQRYQDLFVPEMTAESRDALSAYGRTLL